MSAAAVSGRQVSLRSDGILAPEVTDTSDGGGPLIIKWPQLRQGEDAEWIGLQGSKQ
jgi:hypothetical protein